MSNNDQKLKILLFGRIGDETEAFVAKLTALHGSKAGPFDAAFAVGACNVRPLMPKNDKAVVLPLPVYLQEPLQDVETLELPKPEAAAEENNDSSSSSSSASSSSNCVQVQENLFILRRPQPPYEPTVWNLQVAPKKPPLVVAVCPSHWRMPESATAMASHKLLSTLNHVSYTGCDLLLTTEWPQGVEQTLTAADKQQQNDNNNTTAFQLSFDVAQVALRARARYHVAVGEHFVQSNPFGHLQATTNTVTTQHTGRFLALAPVRNAADFKAVPDKKLAKFVHALGLQPLHSMSQTEILAQRPATGLLPCPYTDASYYVDGPSGCGSHAITNTSTAGLSEAQARRILAEEQHGGGADFRFGQRAKRKQQDNQPETIDPTNTTLFVHGLHQDVTGVLPSPRGDAVLLQAFAKFQATGVRKPPNAATSSFAFVDFATHDAALRCWTDLHGLITVNGVELTVKWATHKRRSDDQAQQPSNKKRRLTEAEARDSSTIYFTMGPQFRVDADGKNLENYSERLRVWMEGTLEEALAGGGSERVKAADEPALQVQKRLPTGGESSDDPQQPNFGFLEFASHAAASMALATVTGSTDGGLVLPDAPALPAKDFVNIRLHWGKVKPTVQKEKEFVEDTESGFRFERKHFPADSRKDCWFCLASESCEKHLITGVYDQCYAAMPKGPIHEGHILLVPVQHTSQGALQDETLSEEMDRIKSGLREHASKEYDMDLFVFERAMQTKGGYHTHVQCIPVPRQKGMEIRATMIAQGRRANADIRELTSDLGLSAVLGNSDDADRGYFYAEVPVSASEYRRFLYKAGETGSIPLQFGREVVATVLRQPDLAHWKSCLVDKDRESQMAAKLRESLPRYTE